MIASPVQTFKWKLYRPAIDDFKSDLIVEKLNLHRLYIGYTSSDAVRPMAWYIEGEERGILYDALQTGVDVANLKEYVDENLATSLF